MNTPINTFPLLYSLENSHATTKSHRIKTSSIFEQFYLTQKQTKKEAGQKVSKIEESTIKF